MPEIPALLILGCVRDSKITISIAIPCPPSGGAGNGNGDGDGLIKAWYGWAGGGDWNCEVTQAASSLRLSNLMPTESNVPACPSVLWGFTGFNNSCAYYYADDLYAKITPIKINGIAWATIDASGRVRSGALSPVQARLIDEKIDNGNPNSGKFRGLDATVQSIGGSIVDYSCSTSGAYNLNEDYTCRALYYFK